MAVSPARVFARRQAGLGQSAADLEPLPKSLADTPARKDDSVREFRFFIAETGDSAG